jgi:hypothetical protein
MQIMQVISQIANQELGVFSFWTMVLWLGVVRSKHLWLAPQQKQSMWAACTCTKYVIWMRRLLANLNFPQPQATKLYSDNQASIRLVHNPKFHRRTRHTDVQYHFIREHQHLRNINILYIPTTNQLVDLLTVFSIFAPSWAWYHSRQRKWWWEQ